MEKLMENVKTETGLKKDRKWRIEENIFSNIMSSWT